MKMINKSNTRKEILVVFVPFRTLIQSVATKSDQPGVVSKVSVEKEASENEGRRGQVRPSDGEKCLKTLKDTVWSEHPQATSVFLLEKIKTVMPPLARLLTCTFCPHD